MFLLFFYKMFIKNLICELSFNFYVDFSVDALNFNRIFDVTPNIMAPVHSYLQFSSQLVGQPVVRRHSQPISSQAIQTATFSRKHAHFNEKPIEHHKLSTSKPHMELEIQKTIQSSFRDKISRVYFIFDISITFGRKLKRYILLDFG